MCSPDWPGAPPHHVPPHPVLLFVNNIFSFMTLLYSFMACVCVEVKHAHECVSGRMCGGHRTTSLLPPMISLSSSPALST